MVKKVGVLLAGCGVFDGTEIHEATLTLYFLDREGADSLYVAPDNLQHHVIDHQASSVTKEKRNVLSESARIARGQIQALSTVSSSDMDGLILPGGFGAVKNLADYAIHGRDCTIDLDVQRLICDMVDAGKPVGAMCVAPVVVALALREKAVHPLLTIGNDVSTAADIVHFGGRHQNATVDNIVRDEENKIVSTPAYMLGPSIAHVAKGIEKLVMQVVAWA